MMGVWPGRGKPLSPVPTRYEKTGGCSACERPVGSAVRTVWARNAKPGRGPHSGPYRRDKKEIHPDGDEPIIASGIPCHARDFR